LPLPECANAAGGITIVVTTVGTNAQAGNSFSAGIRFLIPSSSSAPEVFAVNFVMDPNPGTRNVPVTFSDAGSVSPGHAIANSGFRWTFSDGTSKIGPSVTHDFGAAGTYVVTLTITDDIGQSGSKSALLTIN
jgi:PKD repeat protein